MRVGNSCSLRTMPRRRVGTGKGEREVKAKLLLLLRRCRVRLGGGDAQKVGRAPYVVSVSYSALLSRSIVLITDLRWCVFPPCSVYLDAPNHHRLLAWHWHWQSGPDAHCPDRTTCKIVRWSWSRTEQYVIRCKAWIPSGPITESLLCSNDD